MSLIFVLVSASDYSHFRLELFTQINQTPNRNKTIVRSINSWSNFNVINSLVLCTSKIVVNSILRCVRKKNKKNVTSANQKSEQTEENNWNDINVHRLIIFCLVVCWLSSAGQKNCVSKFVTIYFAVWLANKSCQS